MAGTARDEVARGLAGAADDLDALAETAELMGDEAGAERFRADAAHRRMLAMAVLDDDAT